jgi:hypothetical protein
MTREPKEIRENDLIFRLRALGRFPFAGDDWFQNGIDQQMVDEGEMEQTPYTEDPDRNG